MTDSEPATARTGKRERLVAAAADVVHRQGLEGLTLAKAADAAGVPLGNVYYYFKARDDLLRAVVDERVCEVSTLLAALDARTTPKARLKGLARSWTDNADLVVSHGCPLGTLAAELSNHAGLAECAQLPLHHVVDWAAEQFRQMGERNPRARAITLVGAIQGAALLSNAFGDRQLLVAEVRRLERELDRSA